MLIFSEAFSESVLMLVRH